MSIEEKIDHSKESKKSIREKSIQYFIDSKFCRLNSGHPISTDEEKFEVKLDG